MATFDESLNYEKLGIETDH